LGRLNKKTHGRMRMRKTSAGAANTSIGHPSATIMHHAAITRNVNPIAVAGNDSTTCRHVRPVKGNGGGRVKSSGRFPDHIEAALNEPMTAMKEATMSVIQSLTLGVEDKTHLQTAQ
jgi:hypothetical protein